MLSKEQFLTESGLRREVVEVEGLGEVKMRELSVGERMEWEKKHEATEGEDRDVVTSLALVAVSLCNDDGSPMFSEDEIHQAVEALKAKPERVVEQLQRAFLRISGLTDEAVEQAVGNSIEIPSEPPSTDSPGISDTQPSNALQVS